MRKIRIKTDQIKNWKTFHTYFADQFNFPEYYGQNMNAWIDCMEDFAIDGLTVLEFGDCRSFKERIPEIHKAILESSAFINYRSTESGKKPMLIISMG